MLDGYSLDYGLYCDAWKTNTMGPARRQCGMPAVEDFGGVISLCRFHAPMLKKEVRLAVRAEFKDEIDGLKETIDGYRNPDLELLARRRANFVRAIEESAAEAPKKPEQIVYFIHCEGFIKIGMSVDPESRLKNIQISGNGTYAPKRIDLTTAHIMATEAGGARREAELHAQFANLRHVGEWFRESPELVAYIEAIEPVFPALSA